MTSVPAERSARRWIAVALGWLFPGLGHFYLGRKRSALVYAAVVTVTFVLGLSF